MSGWDTASGMLWMLVAMYVLGTFARSAEKDGSHALASEFGQWGFLAFVMAVLWLVLSVLIWFVESL